MVYKSKQDWWLTLIIWGALLFAIGSGVYALIKETPDITEVLITLCLTIILPIFLLWICLSTRYEIGKDKLIIKFGPFRKVVELDSIKSVRKTMNPISSPALSLKRLEITYGQGNVVLISPKNREEFMEVIAKRCPNATITK